MPGVELVERLTASVGVFRPIDRLQHGGDGFAVLLCQATPSRQPGHGLSWRAWARHRGKVPGVLSPAWKVYKTRATYWNIYNEFWFTKNINNLNVLNMESDSVNLGSNPGPPAIHLPDMTPYFQFPRSPE
jgi:hypothetical protein